MTSFWDPGNLLQVTDDLRSRAGEIKCLGKNRHNARCGWDVPQPSHSEVGPLLRAMSQVKPEAITTETLRRLATLCLCVDFHSHQVDQVVRHWRRVLDTATQHHQRLLSMEIPESDEVQTLQADLASKQEECDELKRKLDVEIASNTQQNDEWEDKSEEMTTKITHLEQQLSRSEYRLKITEAATSDQEQAKQALLEQNKEESAARTKAEEENATLKSKLKAHEDKLKASEDELKIVRGENKNLTKDLATVRESNEVGIEACQDEIRQLKETVQGLTKERDERDAKIREYHAQLGKQLAQNTLLDDRIASLEQTRVQLEASIVSCWMHSFWTWTTRFKGRRGKPQLVEGNMELKTYA
ncbi:hypothetical protein CEP51_010094 [Fusarium floridanum]|uniref:Uncharacterized protein n=1 Tax=Fusarium floridanum TaxID=1325733 RepID=A0A428RFJ4_9HYPO|nr:hypothetical protein CEP51_010094 [Fusarium floridanum]